jgi:Trypsin-co-occurring domain 2
VAELGLAEAVEALRAELVAALSAGANEWMRFGLAPIELTLQAAVTKWSRP